MGITDKLNTAWAANESMDAVFAVRAAIQNLSYVAKETKATVDAIVADASFAAVDAEIKARGQELISIVDQLNTALDTHSEFIDWTQP